MKLFFRKNRGVWGIVFCVSKTRQYPKYGESGKRFALSFRKKAGGQSENFAALLHKPPSRPPFGYAVIKRGWISPCGGAGGAISPLKKTIFPYWEQRIIKKTVYVQIKPIIKTTS